MSGKSAIEWTDAVWNPTTGCSKVSPGCAHCYAEALSKRYAGANGWPAEFKPWTPDNAAENVILHPDRLDAPLHWKTPRRVFVNSMSDLFHEQVPDEFIDRVFSVMARTPQHTYQVLTKRPERFVRYSRMRCQENGQAASFWSAFENKDYRPSWPLSNVWLGVSVENQRWADERIPILLDTPAAVRFISAEPLLGPLDLTHLYGHVNFGDHVDLTVDALSGMYTAAWAGRKSQPDRPLDTLGRGKLDWVIVGGESGSRHRPFDPEWARSIVAQCRDAGVAVFVKQLGGARPGNALEDLPEDLRVREYPQ